jgi:hypothetical protein
MHDANCHRRITRRAALTAMLGGGGSLLTGCAGGGHFSLLGYSTAPNYDPEIRSVYVPVFKNRAFVTTPIREIEFILTRAVVDAIESKTPMKVSSNPSTADSELQGSIVTVTKLVTNRTPQNEAREIALYLTAEIVWHDLRPGQEGKILTNPRKRESEVPPIGLPFDPSVPPPQVRPELPQPATLSSVGRAVPELGESVTTAMHMAVDRMAIQIVNAMEKPW